MQNQPRVVFMGSPEFAMPSLKALVNEYDVAGVVTQPDRLAGRGRSLVAPQVKHLAFELGLPCIQPERLHLSEVMQQLQRWSPDVIVVAAFGQILRQALLDLPRHGCINVHASLLPRWRGAAPVNAAILHGDSQTGATIMKMDAGVDTGPILSQRRVPILPDDTAASLSPRLAECGAALLIETLPGYLNGTIQPYQQDESHATYAPMLKKEDGWLDFSLPAVVLARRVRAMQPWPGSFFEWSGGLLKVHLAHAVEGESPGSGIHLLMDGCPAIGTQQGILVLDQVQPAGRNIMPGKAFLAGGRKWAE